MRLKHIRQEGFYHGFVGLAPKVYALTSQQTKEYMKGFTAGDKRRESLNLKGVTETDINPISLLTDVERIKLDLEWERI